MSKKRCECGNEIDAMRDALLEIRDIARTSLKPDAVSEREYWQMKLNRIASIVSEAIKDE